MTQVPDYLFDPRAAELSAYRRMRAAIPELDMGGVDPDSLDDEQRAAMEAYERAHELTRRAAQQRPARAE